FRSYIIITLFYFIFFFFLFCFFFFFQAEDGIRDRTVTGVQTCALPISIVRRASALTSNDPCAGSRPRRCAPHDSARAVGFGLARSEERRVGKECRCGWGPEE